MNYDHIYKRFEEPSAERGDKVIWQDVDGGNNRINLFLKLVGPEEYKDLPRALSKEIEVPFKERDEDIRPSAYNRKVWEQYKKYERRLRRYKQYKLKTPKDRSLDKAWERGESVMVDRDWKLRKFGFEETYLELEEEPDDE